MGGAKLALSVRTPIAITPDMTLPIHTPHQSYRLHSPASRGWPCLAAIAILLSFQPVDGASVVYSDNLDSSGSAYARVPQFDSTLGLLTAVSWGAGASFSLATELDNEEDGYVGCFTVAAGEISIDFAGRTYRQTLDTGSSTMLNPDDDIAPDFTGLDSWFLESFAGDGYGAFETFNLGRFIGPGLLDLYVSAAAGWIPTLCTREDDASRWASVEFGSIVATQTSWWYVEYLYTPTSASLPVPEGGPSVGFLALLALAGALRRRA